MNGQQAQVDFALEVDRQRRELIQSAQQSRFSLTYVTALIWPVAMIALAFLSNDLSESDKLIAFGASLGLLSLATAFEIELSRRTRVLLRLLERQSGEIQ